MRLYEAKEIIANIPDDMDVAVRFGAVKGTLTAGELRDMMKGHHDDESVQPKEDGRGVWITDWTKTKFFVGE